MIAKPVYNKGMKPRNLTPLIKKYGSGYIARNIKTGRVLAHNKRIDILFKKVGGNKDIVIGWLPEPNVRYAFVVSD